MIGYTMIGARDLEKSVAFYDGIQLIEWARNTQYLDVYAEDGDVAELISTNNNVAKNVERSVVLFYGIYERYWGDLKVPSQYTECIARELFVKRLREYVDGECKPFNVCEVFKHIEPIFDFPSWLGDMYNACDWVEPNTVPADCPYLKEASEDLLSKI